MTTFAYVSAAIGLFALLVYLEWRTWDVARGFTPWSRWLVAWIDFVNLLPVAVVAFAALAHWLLSISFSTLGMATPFAAVIEGVKDHPGVIVAPVIFQIIYKSWFFYLVSRWEIGRGLFLLPSWPRQPFTRGPQRHRPREFREPLPWTRGPGSW